MGNTPKPEEVSPVTSIFESDRKVHIFPGKVANAKPGAATPYLQGRLCLVAVIIALQVWLFTIPL